jgi:hypothetical protein
MILTIMCSIYCIDSRPLADFTSKQYVHPFLVGIAAVGRCFEAEAVAMAQRSHFPAIWLAMGVCDL